MADNAAVAETVPAPVVGHVETTPAPTEPVVDKSATPVAEEAKGEAKAEVPEVAAEIVYDLKAPQGVDLDPAAISAFTEFAKAEKLPNDLAQKIVEYGIKRQTEIESASAKSIETTMLKEEAAALETLKKHPTLGGANYDQTLKLAAEGFSKFASKDEMEFINATRLGNRVEMISLFRKVALAMREDGVSGSQGRAPNDGRSEQDILRERYPSMFDKE